VSQENVKIVRAIFSGADVDLLSRFRDDERWTATVESQARFYDPEVETMFAGLTGDRRSYRGLDELRMGWLDWMAAWQSYRTVLRKVIDLDDRVLVLYDTYGRLPGSQTDVTAKRASVVTFDHGTVRRWEVYEQQAEALKAVRLEE
jgi:hypothetical protein